jgi:hypothetical protein
MASSNEENLSPAPELVHDKTQDYETGKTVIDKKADIGLQFLAQHEHVEYSVAEERRLRWKIDLFLLPVVRFSQNDSNTMIDSQRSCP